MGLRSAAFVLAFLLACGRTDLLSGTQDSSSIGGLAGAGGPDSATDAAAPDTPVPGDECTGEAKPNGCPCANSAQCENKFCATTYAPRSGSSECADAKVGTCRAFPQHECACMVANYGNEGHCYD